MRASQSECVGFLRTDVVYVTVSNYSTIAGWRSPATARKFCSLHRRMLPLLLCLTTHHHLCLLYVWYSWANLSCCWQVHQHRCIDAGDGDGWCSVNDHVFSSNDLGQAHLLPLLFPFSFWPCFTEFSYGNQFVVPKRDITPTTMPLVLNPTQVGKGLCSYLSSLRIIFSGGASSLGFQAQIANRNRKPSFQAEPTNRTEGRCRILNNAKISLRPIPCQTAHGYCYTSLSVSQHLL